MCSIRLPIIQRVALWACTYILPRGLTLIDIAESWQHSEINGIIHFKHLFSYLLVAFLCLVWLMILLSSFTPAWFWVWRCSFFSLLHSQTFHMEGQTEVEQHRARFSSNASTCKTKQNKKLQKKKPRKADLTSPRQAKWCIKTQLKGALHFRVEINQMLC